MTFIRRRVWELTLQVGERNLSWSEVTFVVGEFLNGKRSAWMNGKAK